MVSFWGKQGMRMLSAGSALAGMRHLFWYCTFPPSPLPSSLPMLHVRELPQFMPLMARDRSKWPRCLPWHGWLLGLSTAGERDPWAGSAC